MRLIKSWLLLLLLGSVDGSANECRATMLCTGGRCIAETECGVSRQTAPPAGSTRPTDSSFDSLLREPFNRSTLSNCRGGYWTNCKAVLYRPEFAYVGEWQNDKHHGLGSIDYYNGDKFIGEFKEGLYDGLGSLFDRNGRLKQSGIWRAGSLVQEAGVSKAEANASPRQGSALTERNTSQGRVKSDSNQLLRRF